MNIKIWLQTNNGQDLSTDLVALDPNFKWESEHIPAIGDNVSINLDDLEHLSHFEWAYTIGWIDGKVVEREFTVGKNEVELTLEVDKTVGNRLIQVLSGITPAV